MAGVTDLHLPAVNIEVMDDEGRIASIALDRSAFTTSEAPYLLGQVQMTMSLLHAYTDLLKHLSGIATEAAARDIRMEEKRNDK